MITIADIQQRFPDPVSCHSGKIGGCDYCIGGAVCQFVGMPYTFPQRAILAVALQRLNPHLKAEIAYPYAVAIINLNDEYEFEEAWAVVNEALNAAKKD